MQREIQAGRHPAGRDEIAVVDHPRVNDADAGGLQHVHAEVVGDRVAALEQTGHRQGE